MWIKYKFVRKEISFVICKIKFERKEIKQVDLRVR